MKENQIIIVLFIVLGLFAVYFFSQSTLFQEDNNEIESVPSLLQPINQEIPVVSEQSNTSIPVQPEPIVEDEVVLVEDSDPIIKNELSEPDIDINISNTFASPK